jgi:uncharacterized membrane protein
MGSRQNQGLLAIQPEGGRAAAGANREQSGRQTGRAPGLEIIALGRLIFAVAMMAFGIEHLITARFGLATMPVIPFVPGNPFLAYPVGLALLAGGVSIAINRRARLASILLGILFLLCVLLIEIPRSAARPLNVSVRTVFFESLAMGASALTLAGTLPAWRTGFLEGSRAVDRLIGLGPLLFAVSAVVFGIDHFLVLDVIAGLVPAWIPWGMFWAYFTGAGFIAAGVSIATGRMAYWGAAALGLMFLLWFLLLHAPRIMSFPRSHNPDEWSSAFIALGMCGGSWIAAWHAARPNRELRRSTSA